MNESALINLRRDGLMIHGSSAGGLPTPAASFHPSRPPICREREGGGGGGFVSDGLSRRKADKE